VIRPLRDYIVVRPLERKLSATLVIVAGRNMKPNVDAAGEVLAVGPGKRNKRGAYVPLDVKPGDVVHFEEHKTYPKIDGLLMLQQADVAGIEA
jgi:chaperonin GroES